MSGSPHAPRSAGARERGLSADCAPIRSSRSWRLVTSFLRSVGRGAGLATAALITAMYCDEAMGRMVEIDGLSPTMACMFAAAERVCSLHSCTADAADSIVYVRLSPGAVAASPSVIFLERNRRELTTARVYDELSWSHSSAHDRDQFAGIEHALIDALIDSCGPPPSGVSVRCESLDTSAPTSCADIANRYPPPPALPGASRQ